LIERSYVCCAVIKKIIGGGTWGHDIRIQEMRLGSATSAICHSCFMSNNKIRLIINNEDRMTEVALIVIHIKNISLRSSTLASRLCGFARNGLYIMHGSAELRNAKRQMKPIAYKNIKPVLH